MEKERERNIVDQLPLIHTPAGDWSYNPGMRPVQELNQ